MQPAPTSRAHRLARQALKGDGTLYSMTRPDSWAAASTERHAEDTKATFRSVLPRKAQVPESKDWSTVHQDAFGVGDGQGRIARLAGMGPRSPATGTDEWARGRPGGRSDKGKNTTGAMGEVFKLSAEPQHDTAAQRSWLYNEDPMLTLKKGGGYATPGCTVHASAGESKSLHGVGEGGEKSYDPEANTKRKAILTKAFDRHALPPHGRTVFLDD